MESPKVLVVEDEKGVANLIRDILKLMGRETLPAGNGMEAVVAMENQNVTFAMVDLMLPGEISSVELYERITTTNPRLKDRVVFMSGGNVPEPIQSILDSTDCRFMPKPFTVGEFRELLKEWLV